MGDEVISMEGLEVCSSMGSPEDGVGLADVHVLVNKPWRFRGQISGMIAGR
jgi:hypothetical protein